MPRYRDESLKHFLAHLTPGEQYERFFDRVYELRTALRDHQRGGDDVREITRKLDALVQLVRPAADMPTKAPDTIWWDRLRELEQAERDVRREST